MSLHKIVHVDWLRFCALCKGSWVAHLEALDSLASEDSIQTTV